MAQLHIPEDTKSRMRLKIPRGPISARMSLPLIERAHLSEHERGYNYVYGYDSGGLPPGWENPQASSPSVFWASGNGLSATTPHIPPQQPPQFGTDFVRMPKRKPLPVGQRAKRKPVPDNLASTKILQSSNIAPITTIQPTKSISLDSGGLTSTKAKSQQEAEVRPHVRVGFEDVPALPMLLRTLLLRLGSRTKS